MAQALGFDFGTTNTVLAMADGGATRSMAFTSTEGTADSMRTALSFMKDAQLGASALKVEAGHAAIRQFIDNPGECRFLQSIKTFAASALFQGTLIFAKRHNFEDLMEVFVRRLRNYAGDNWPSDVGRIVTGRPVHFAGASLIRRWRPSATMRRCRASAFPKSTMSTSRSPPPSISRRT